MELEEQLLDAVLASPDDDAPRLVYADWLTAKGDPRGELITVQCRLARLGDADDRRTLRARENQLLSAHASTWAAALLEVIRERPLPGRFGLAEPSYTFVRGFVEEVAVSLDVLERGEPIFAAAPLLRTLRVNGPLVVPQDAVIEQPSLHGAFESAAFKQLTSLDVRVLAAGDEGARCVGRAASLSGLERLRLSLTVWGDDRLAYDAPDDQLVLTSAGARALAQSTSLRGLRELDLQGNRITNAGIEALVNAPWDLERLELKNNPLGEVAAQVLATAPRLEHLEHLGLANSAPTYRGAAALAASPSLHRLASLDLEGCELRPEGIAAFLEAMQLPALRSLRLERNGLGEAGALALARSPKLRQLKSLELGHNRIGKKGAAALASSEHLVGLERLLLNESQWKDEHVAFFANSETLRHCKIYLKGRALARPRAASRRSR